MSPTKSTPLVLASVAAGLLAVGAAVAVPARMSRHGGMSGELGFGGGIGRALASLDLTDEQQDRLDSIGRRFEDRIEKRVGLARTLWKEHAADFVDAL